LLCCPGGSELSFYQVRQLDTTTKIEFGKIWQDFEMYKRKEGALQARSGTGCFISGIRLENNSLKNKALIDLI
jgi:hypothetical protein